MSIVKRDKPVIHLLRGLPGAGKTTRAMELLLEEERIKRVSKSDLRHMLNGGVYSQENEIFIIEMRNIIIREAILKNYSVIVDDTNMNPVHFEAIKDLAKTLKVEAIVHDMNTPLQICIERDAQREHPVGEIVIRRMYMSYSEEVTAKEPNAQ